MILARALLVAALVTAGGQGSALTLEQCARTTHPSHGGEAGHRDVGGGRVAYAEWWSQEGVYLDFIVADCSTGQALRVRAREERISARPPFDRRQKVRKILETEFSGAPAFFNFDRLAKALHPTGRDIAIATLAVEPCACAAAYPDLTGDRTPFEGLSE